MKCLSNSELQCSSRYFTFVLSTYNIDLRAEERDDGQPHIVNYPQCKEDIAKHCNRQDINLKSDMAVLECLQDAGQSETEALTSPCEHLVWEFKVIFLQLFAIIIN